MKKKLPISFVTVIYNEDHVLDRCLKSVASFVDEIIVLHDGHCTDNSKSISQKYGAKFIEQPRKKEAEFHRIDSYKLAKNDWILELDADEYLSNDLQKNLKYAINKDCDILSANWELYSNNKSYINIYPKKFLFKKSKITFVGCPHESVNSKRDKVIFLPYLIYHRPLKDYYFNYRDYYKKINSWSLVHAKALKNWEQLERYGFDNSGGNFKKKTANEFIARNVFFIIFLIIPFILFSSLKQVIKKKNLFFLKLSLFNISYYIILFFKILFLYSFKEKA